MTVIMQNFFTQSDSASFVFGSLLYMCLRINLKKEKINILIQIKIAFGFKDMLYYMTGCLVASQNKHDKSFGRFLFKVVSCKDNYLCLLMKNILIRH